MLGFYGDGGLTETSPLVSARMPLSPQPRPRGKTFVPPQRHPGVLHPQHFPASPSMVATSCGGLLLLLAGATSARLRVCAPLAGMASKQGAASCLQRP